jgi:hypothetical protein
LFWSYVLRSGRCPTCGESSLCPHQRHSSPDFAAPGHPRPLRGCRTAAWLCCTNPVRDSFCESSVIAGLDEQTEHTDLLNLNWPACSRALKRRGSLAIWFDPDLMWAAKLNGKPGWLPVYSDAAVQTCLTMKVLFGMARRVRRELVAVGRSGLECARLQYSEPPPDRGRTVVSVAPLKPAEGWP